MAGYSFNFLIRSGYVTSGELPESYEQYNRLLDDKSYEEVLSDLEVDDNSLTYIEFKDYHYAVDDWYARPGAGKAGNDVIGRALDMIESKLKLEDFDLTLMYSDHGWRMSHEPMRPIINQIGDNRTKITMFLRKKGDNTVSKSNKLCSILDVGRTICDEAGIEMGYQNEGISLFDQTSHEFIMIEDHKNFNVTLDQTIEVWGIRTENNLICINPDGEWDSLSLLTDQEKRKWNLVFEEYGSCFIENRKAALTYLSYRRMKYGTSTYFDGGERYKHPDSQIIMNKIKRRLRHALDTPSGKK